MRDAAVPARLKGGIRMEVKEIMLVAVKIAATIAALLVTAVFGTIGALLIAAAGMHPAMTAIGGILILSLLLPLIWLKRRSKFLRLWLVPALIYCAALGTNYGMVQHDKSITINTSPNIDVHEYLPFREDSRIVRLRSETLQLAESLPRIDGAAALFPVYSAFVNAVYPQATELGDGVFEYNNTPAGYKLLAERRTDIFIGAYPSQQQRDKAEECGTTFQYTPIGAEAFVFIVHKDNPVDSLTTEQLRGIYSGEITNWSQVGGKDEAIAAFQRNQGSGSQTMLERFMDGKPLMAAPTELKNDLMSGIVERVSSYRNKTGSIGFSFRFYVEGIIRNPDIKMLSIDGIAPTGQNIRSGSYPATTPIYAVTYREQDNRNVGRLVEWMLSEEGQHIIEETGYVGLGR